VTPLRRLLALGTVATALAATSAGAAPNLLSPAPGSSTTSTHPTFSWSLPGGERAVSISVARLPDINPATNDFMPGELATTAILAGDASKWTPTQPLPASKYYWHVSTRTQDRPREFSAASSFVVRPLIAKPTIEAKPFKGQRMFLITTTWTANVRMVDFSADLFAGTKRVAQRRLKTDNVLIDPKKVDVSTWMVPSTVKNGARLRFVVKLSAEGAKASATKLLRVP
jgi:hypothetical protein